MLKGYPSLVKMRYRFSSGDHGQVRMPPNSVHLRNLFRVRVTILPGCRQWSLTSPERRKRANCRWPLSTDTLESLDGWTDQIPVLLRQDRSAKYNVKRPLNLDMIIMMLWRCSTSLFIGNSAAESGRFCTASSLQSHIHVIGIASWHIGF